MKLTDYIQQYYSGNISEFARSQGVLPNQARRWLERDCEWHDGAVWCKITKQKQGSTKE
jgi:hypothetical protein